MTLGWYRVSGIVLLALGASMPALAQDERKAEVSAGYQLITFNGDDVDETFSRGWYADVAGNIGPIFAVVVQVGGSYKSFEETETFAGVTSTVTASLKLHQFLGGVRVGPRHKSVSPYAEFLVGGVNGSADVEGSVVGGGQTLFSSSESDSSTELALLFGGGVTIWLNEGVGIRGSVGYMRIMADDAGSNIIRVAGGVTFGF